LQEKVVGVFVRFRAPFTAKQPQPQPARNQVCSMPPLPDARLTAVLKPLMLKAKAARLLRR
jgi:hypothetical protein